MPKTTAEYRTLARDAELRLDWPTAVRALHNAIAAYPVRMLGALALHDLEQLRRRLIWACAEYRQEFGHSPVLPPRGTLWPCDDE